MTFEEKIKNNIYPSKEQIIDLYLNQGLSQTEICGQFSIKSRTTFRHLLEYYNIKISKEQQKRIYQNSNAKREKTCLQKYGHSFASQADEIKEKQKQTCINKYGTISFTQTEEYHNQKDSMLEKREQTCLKKYGVSSVAQVEEFQCKRSEYIKNKYNITSTRQMGIPEEIRKIVLNKDTLTEFLLKHQNPQLSIQQLCSMLGCKYSFLQSHIKEYELQDLVDFLPHKSSGEDELYDLLTSWGIHVELNNRTVLEGYEVDLYCPDLRLAIEFNGDYWHSDACKDKQYHFTKSNIAEKNNIRLIHIYEHEWKNPRTKDKIISLLKISTGKVDKKIYARDCEVRIISNKEAKILNEKVHLQGHRNAKITYGLYYHGELVQLMSFSHHQKYEWEIIRGCPGSNNIVIGGVSKLFNHFINDYHPSQIFSYCDYNKFNGKSYEAIGMKFIGFTGPDKTWILPTTVAARNSSKYQEYKQSSLGIIWGAGSKKYLWTK